MQSIILDVSRNECHIENPTFQRNKVPPSFYFGSMLKTNETTHSKPCRLLGTWRHWLQYSDGGVIFGIFTLMDHELSRFQAHDLLLAVWNSPGISPQLRTVPERSWLHFDLAHLHNILLSPNSMRTRLPFENKGSERTLVACKQPPWNRFELR